MQALHIVNKIRIVFAWFAAKVALKQRLQISALICVEDLDFHFISC